MNDSPMSHPPVFAKLKPQVQTPTDRTTNVYPVKIRAINVNFYYTHKHALKSITMDIKERQITALIGPSGCGKSTFLRTLNRMNEFIPGARLEGKILIDGVGIYDKSVDVNYLRRRVGMIFQRSNPLPKSIYENIAYGVRVNHLVTTKSALDDIVAQALKDAALWDEVKDDLKKSALALSGGQQQRLCIARALAIKPEILLMDEPASALDPISTAKIEELILELRRHYTIVIVTHNMQQAARASDWTGFFLSGELIEFDATAKMFTNPGKKATEDYITGRFG